MASAPAWRPRTAVRSSPAVAPSAARSSRPKAVAVHTAIATEGALRRLKNRSEFLRVARGKRFGRPGFSLQTNDNGRDDAGLGFTVTKLMGNSPERNRIRRRLRAAAEACAGAFQTRHDYVLVGRREALSLPFDQLVGDLTHSLSKIHLKKKS